jgi:hypothetical protein
LWGDDYRGRLDRHRKPHGHRAETCGSESKRHEPNVLKQIRAIDLLLRV